MNWPGNSYVRDLVLAGAISAMTVAASIAHANDIQIINLGPHILYLPKGWMKGAHDALPGQGRVLAQNPPNVPVEKAQSGPIDATTLDIWPGVDWQPYSARDLPEIIEIIYGSGHGQSPLDEQQKRWIDQVASQQPDGDGFVRVVAGLAKPNERPAWETFLYKDYLNKMRQPLVVHSNNMRAPQGNPYLSDVTIRAQADLILAYHFDNERFPENRWWDLYQHVVAFLDYSTAPK